jgi:hypothetical protein
MQRDGGAGPILPEAPKSVGLLMDAPREPQDWQFALYLSGSALKATSRDSSVDSIGPRRTSSIVDLRHDHASRTEMPAVHPAASPEPTTWIWSSKLPPLPRRSTWRRRSLATAGRGEKPYDRRLYPLSQIRDSGSGGGGNLHTQTTVARALPQN